MVAVWNNFITFLDNTFGQWVTPGVILTILSFIGSVLLLSLARSLFNRVLRKKEFKSKELIQMLVNMLYLVLFFVLISVHFSSSSLLNMIVFTIGTSDISILVLIIAAFVVIFALKISSFTRKYILPGAYEKYELDTGAQFTFSQIFHYVVLVLAILISLNIIGINITSLTIFASLFGVGIGFGMQNIISNFISGIILLFERPIRVGDRVVVDEILGEVVEIKIRATVVRTLDNEHIIVPNSYFLEQRIINSSYGDLKIRIAIDVGVSYSSDVKLTENLLLEAVKNISAKTGHILKKPEPVVRFMAFGESSLDFKLYVWVNRPANTYRVRSDLHFEILDLFRKNKIEIPFPQRDVHMIDGE